MSEDNGTFRKVNINEVKTAVKVADAILDEDPTKFKLSYNSSLSKSVLRSKNGRVYLIVVDGEIKKIGGSCSKGGIRQTLDLYRTGMSGKPSIRSFGICYLIKQCLDKGSKVEFYMIAADDASIPVKGLFSTEDQTIKPFKEMEDKCKGEYKKIAGDYPEWNYQERHIRWSVEIRDKHSELLKEPLKENYEPTTKK